LNEISYIGVTILCAEKFMVNLQRTRHKYFRALNAIFGKIRLNYFPVAGYIVYQFCCIYTAESVTWNQKMLKGIENAYCQFFMKMFHTFDNNIKCMKQITTNMTIQFKPFRTTLLTLYAF